MSLMGLKLIGYYIVLMKEVYVNMEMGLKNWTPDCANHENRISDLMDIQMSITELKFRSIDLPVC